MSADVMTVQGSQSMKAHQNAPESHILSQEIAHTDISPFKGSDN
jgi:hypothetical protein